MNMVVPIAAEAPALRFDYFASAVSSVFCPMACELPCSSRQEFQASLTLNRLNELALSVVGSSPLVVHRRRRDIAQAGEAWYLVKFQLEGEALIRQRDREAHLRPGDFVMCSTSEPYSLHFPASYREAVLAVPQARLRDLVRAPDAWLGMRMAADHPVNGILSSFVCALSARVDRIDAGLAQRLEANLLDLLVTALQADGQRGLNGPDTASRHLYNARSYIRLHLADPELGPDRIARAEGISTRYLHMLFKGAGESVSRYIQSQRLEACRQCLSRAEMNGFGVSEIAYRWGFNDSSHFSRLFKAEYGVTPRAYRLQSQAA